MKQRREKRSCEHWWPINSSHISSSQLISRNLFVAHQFVACLFVASNTLQCIRCRQLVAINSLRHVYNMGSNCVERERSDTRLLDCSLEIGWIYVQRCTNSQPSTALFDRGRLAMTRSWMFQILWSNNGFFRPAPKRNVRPQHLMTSCNNFIYLASLVHPPKSSRNSPENHPLRLPNQPPQVQILGWCQPRGRKREQLISWCWDEMFHHRCISLISDCFEYSAKQLARSERDNLERERERQRDERKVISRKLYLSVEHWETSLSRI